MWVLRVRKRGTTSSASRPVSQASEVNPWRKPVTPCRSRPGYLMKNRFLVKCYNIFVKLRSTATILTVNRRRLHFKFSQLKAVGSRTHTASTLFLNKTATLNITGELDIIERKVYFLQSLCKNLLLLCILKSSRKIHSIFSLPRGEEACHANVHFISVNHPDLKYFRDIASKTTK